MHLRVVWKGESVALELLGGDLINHFNFDFLIIVVVVWKAR